MLELSQQSILLKGHQQRNVNIKIVPKSVKAKLRFPCFIWLSIKDIYNKKIAESEEKVQNTSEVIQFNQPLSFSVKMPVNTETGIFCEKLIFLSLFVATKRTPTERLLGRISVDLSKIIESKNYERPVEEKLQYCSVPDGTFTFCMEIDLEEQKREEKNEQVEEELKKQFEEFSANREIHSIKIEQSEGSQNGKLTKIKETEQENQSDEMNDLQQKQKREEEEKQQYPDRKEIQPENGKNPQIQEKECLRIMVEPEKKDIEANQKVQRISEQAKKEQQKVAIPKVSSSLQQQSNNAQLTKYIKIIMIVVIIVMVLWMMFSNSNLKGKKK